MRNRRNILIAFLLCATLIVGVGYAAVADVLDVDGTAELGFEDVRNFEENIEFIAAEVYSAGDTASITTTNRDKVTFSVNSVQNGQTVAFFKFTVANNNTQNVTLYLSNYLTAETLTHTDEGTLESHGTTEGNRVYKVGYALCNDNHLSEEDILGIGSTQVGAHAITEITREGVHQYEESGIKVTVEAGKVSYIYVAVTLNDNFDHNPETAEIIEPLPTEATVSATFGLEFNALVADEGAEA